MVDITFEFKPPQQDVKSVHLAGSFNDWSTTENPMDDENGDGVYELTIPLKPGEYQYKFVVNGNTWITDPDNDKTAPDGFGGRNSVLEVSTDRDSEPEGKIGDGKIFADSIWHNQKKRNFVNRISKDKLALRLQTKKNDITRVVLHYRDQNGEKSKIMKHFAHNEGYDYWRTELEVKGAKLEYSFQIFDQDTVIWFDQDGGSEKSSNWFELNLEDQSPFTTPEWVKEAVFYQIFPDRFYNGCKENDPILIETYKNNNERYENITPEWHQGIMPTSHHYLDPDKYTDDSSRIYPKSGWHVFYGGDLQGIEQKLDYIQELGIDALYLNPIFEATANHRYNTAAYEYIDDNLALLNDPEGSNQYFHDFIKKAHQRGIKIVLDAVFNHTGYEHYAFQDVIEKEEKSEYSDWFFIKSYPINTLYEQRTEGVEPNYDCWAGFGAHPRLNVANPEVKEYLFEVTKKWMDPDGDGDPSDGIDGWRLDVANEVRDTDPRFWREWRQLVKEINPEAYITGEIWLDASRYLQGQEFDGVMNYRFREAVLNFIARDNYSAEDFVYHLNNIHIDYPLQAIHSLQNLIGSHDTERFLDSVSQDKDRLKLAALLQFTYPGTPLIYYGDEIGLDGGRDPDNRRTMIWEERPNGEEPDMDLYHYYRQLAMIRKNEPALRQGEISFLLPDNTRKAVVIKRQYQKQDMFVVLNVWDREQEIKINTDNSSNQAIELLTNQELRIKEGQIIIKAKPFSGLIIKLTP